MKKIMFNDRYGLTQAVLEGRKTMTRRIIKLPYGTEGIYDWTLSDHPAPLVSIRTKDGELHDRIPSYQVGEEVAIAQAYNDFYDDGCDPRRFPSGAGWKNKMFVRADLMPHAIRITDIKAERLQDISDKDCLKEGIQSLRTPNGEVYVAGGVRINESDKERIRCGRVTVADIIKHDTPQEAFAALIERPGIGHKGDWSKNPWVFAYSFELVR